MAQRTLAQSVIGSDLYVPAHVKDMQPDQLVVPWDRAITVPVQWLDNPNYQRLVDEGKIETSQSEKAPSPQPPMPDNLPLGDQEILKQLLYGEYTEQLKALLEGWRQAKPVLDDPDRVKQLRTRILPFVYAVRQLEPQLQRRKDVLLDAEDVIKFIEDEQWKTVGADVRPSSSRSDRPHKGYRAARAAKG